MRAGRGSQCIAPHVRSLGVAALGVVALVGTTALPAAAEGDAFASQKVLGPLAISPTSGDLETYMTLTTGGGCPHGTNSITRVYGKGLPVEGENIIGNTEVIEMGSPPADRLTTPVTITLAEAARRQLKPVTLDGLYVLRLDCQAALPFKVEELYGVYVGKIRIKDGKYTALTTTTDLPEPPTPKAGTDSLAMTPVPTPPADAFDPTAARSADADADGDRSAAVPLAASGGVLLLGLGGGWLYQRRNSLFASPVRQRSGSRK